MAYWMKTSLCLLCLLFFISACDTFKKAKTADTKKTSKGLAQAPVDTSAIPSEYSFVDTLPQTDSLALAEGPKNPLDYMTIEEKNMIDEINLLRADPQAYSRYIDDYIQTFVTDPAKDADTKRMEMAAASVLIAELQNLEPLPAIMPHFRLYQVAKLHGKDMVAMKKVTAFGSDGSHPFQRIYDGAGLDGTEYLVVGRASIRETIIARLIESKVTGSSQSFNLLDPRWEYVICHEVGKVGDKNNVWIQLFAFSVEEQDIEVEIFEETLEDADVEVEIFEEPVMEDADVEVETPEGSAVEKEIAPAPAIAVVENENEPGVDFSFMTDEEKEMVDEINLLRTNPKAYLQYVELYAAKYEKEYSAGDEDFKIAVNELKEELKNMVPLSRLQPNEKLYNVARAHGLDNKNSNRFEHIGTDKSDPFERVKRSDLKNYIDEKGYFAPNENLVGGENTPRESVVALLIDAGVSSRGHRRALLQPQWEYVACYKIGVIENLKELKGQEKDDMSNCWVQLFALD